MSAAFNMASMAEAYQATDGLDFRRLFDALPGLYLVLDRDLHIVAISDAHLQATMTRREDAIGRQVFAVYPENPHDPAGAGTASVRASLERVLADGKPEVMPVLRYDIRQPESAGGGYVARYWTPTNTPLLGADGRVQYIIIRAEDVTSYVELQRQQAADRQRTAALAARAEAMESEIYARSQEIAQANFELLLEVDRRRAAQAGLQRESEKLGEAYATLVALKHSHEQLTGMIVHDLRNPLTAALGYLDLLVQKSAALEPSVRGCINHARNGNLTLMAMVNGIIDVMRMEDARMPVRSVPTDIVALLRAKLEEYRAAGTAGGLTLAYHGPPELGFPTDGTLLGRVVDNLVVNALKHTRPGGRVTLAAHATAEDGLELAVSDTGEGIAPADQGRLFQKYGRIEGQALGRSYDTGLGLVFCRMAVELLHGAISVESEPGKGTTFTIAFAG